MMDQPLRTFVEKGYNKDRKKAGITDDDLLKLADDVIRRPKEGSLGGGVYKRRISDKGDVGNYSRVIIFSHHGNLIVFYDGWSKNDVPKKGKEIPDSVLDGYKIQSKVFKLMTDSMLNTELKNKNLAEIKR